MQREEGHRNKWALSLSVFFTLIIFFSFAFYRGYLSFSNKNIVSNPPAGGQVANVVSADLVPSPIQNTKETFKSAFGEIGKKYKEFENSISNVLVPFFTGIEVYERK